jgi:hypothetical protein
MWFRSSAKSWAGRGMFHVEHSLRPVNEVRFERGVGHCSTWNIFQRIAIIGH